MPKGARHTTKLFQGTRYLGSLKYAHTFNQTCCRHYGFINWRTRSCSCPYKILSISIEAGTRNQSLGQFNYQKSIRVLINMTSKELKCRIFKSWGSKPLYLYYISWIKVYTPLRIYCFFFFFFSTTMKQDIIKVLFIY